MLFTSKRCKLAWKLSVGYKLKTLNLLTFLTLSFAVMLGGFNLLVSSFNGWFARRLEYMQPNYYITGSGLFDIGKADFGFRDQCLPVETRNAIKEKPGSGLDFFDGIFLSGTLYVKGEPARSRFALVIGLNFEDAREVFPAIANAYGQEELARFKKERRILVDKQLADEAGFAEGEDFILLLENYYKNINGLKVRASIFELPRTGFKALEGLPIVYVDLGALRLIGGVPDQQGWPLFARAGREVIGPVAFFEARRLKRALDPFKAYFYTPLTSDGAMASIFEALSGIFILMGILLVSLIVVSTSSNLFINFQNRKMDFGLMKAFGFGNADLLALVFMENFFNLLIALCLAVLMNVGVSAMFPSFRIMDAPCNLAVTPSGVATIAALVLVIDVISILRPFAYLRRVDPVIIMREE